MALERLAAVSFSSKVSFCIPVNPLASGNSTADYRGYDQYNQAVVGYERPAEIPWNKELANGVQLIGVVGAPVEIKNLASGKVVAWTRLGFKKSAADTCWINLTFWDELAQTAFQHVQKGNQIYVSGRLISDTVENEDGKVQTYYKVVVQQFNFIERNGSSSSSPSSPSYDEEFNMNASGRKFNNSNNNNTSNMGSIEEQWQAFFASPYEWWDNRKNKRNPKYPDFKHKDTGESLWVEGRYNPSWVKSQLAILDEKMGSVQDENGRKDLSPLGSDEFLSF
ncbi:unnamed protein product [Linum tenue]|uniref:Uncharacterized protein n=1 Tax=Linum tenue TaxID=586396 RepID=A0AAV0IZ79_9ROSI|nr:unnamed protein product [Linum tenue]